MRDRILEILRDKQIAFPDLEMLAAEIEAVIEGDAGDMLSAWWDDEEEDIVYHWPTGGKAEMHLLYSMLIGMSGGIDALKVFELRGYDVTTLRFEIKKRRKET
jgi:hypothetical protein